MRPSLKARIADCVNRPTPQNVMLLFLGGLIALLVGSLLVGQLNLPYVGKTVWDLGVLGVAWLFDEAWHLGDVGVSWAEIEIPLLSNKVAGHYTFVTCALGVLWLNVIYRRVRKTGRYSSRIADCGLTVVSVYLLVVYFAYADEVLPLQASFFARVALYCSISLVVFCFMVHRTHQAKLFVEKPKARRDDELAFDEVAFGVSALVCLISGIASGFHGGDVTVASFFGYRLLNAVLHLLANFGGMLMGVWFVEEVQKSAGAKEAATST